MQRRTVPVGVGMSVLLTVVFSSSLLLLVRGHKDEFVKFELSDLTDDIKGTASWDLSPLQGAHLIHDYRVGNKTEALFNYWLNFGHNIEKSTLPEVCNGEGEGPAFQVDENFAFCYRLGGDTHNDDNVEIELIYEDDPSVGIRMTYLHGTRCGEAGNYNERSFEIEMYCSNDISNVPSKDYDFISEDWTEACHYDFEFATMYACPTECALNKKGTMVCSDHGDCGWDEDANTAKCFCDDAFFGPACEDTCPKSCGNGHCAFDAGKNTARCFCDTGFSGERCQVVGAECSPATTWIVLLLAILVLLAFYAYHRNSHGLPVNPCAGTAGNHHDEGRAGRRARAAMATAKAEGSKYSNLEAAGEPGGYSPPSLGEDSHTI